MSASPSSSRYSLEISATFTAKPLTPALRYWFKRLHLDTDNPSVAPRYLSLAERASRQWVENSDKSWVGRVGKLSGRFGEGLVNKIKVKGERAAANVATSTGMEVGSKIQTVIVRGSLKIVTIPGEHFTIFQEPYVDTLATKLRDVLAQGS